MRKQRRKNSTPLFVFIGITLGLAALIQNPYGQFSDIRGFFGMHFSDGQHQWPFSYHQLLGATSEMHPVEYPALTGLIMWLISFLVGDSDASWQHYYWITALLNSFLFGLSAYILNQFVKSKYVYCYLLSLAVLYSLHRNWDIWAVVPMLVSILYFEKGNYRKSAIFLAISIATKFFPIVLLLPIGVVFYRNFQYKKLLVYISDTLITWICINLPFAIINFDGWFYFYKFSYERGFGGGSLSEMFGKLDIEFNLSKELFFFLNTIIFSIVVIILFKIKNSHSILRESFLIFFAFMIFNKQYSMQYVIWLTPLALMSINELPRLKQKAVMLYFLIWQVLELAFQFAFFQNILTNTGIERSQILTSTPVSDFNYGITSLLRYLAFILFAVMLTIEHLKDRASNKNVRK